MHFVYEQKTFKTNQFWPGEETSERRVYVHLEKTLRKRRRREEEEEKDTTWMREKRWRRRKRTPSKEV